MAYNIVYKKSVQRDLKKVPKAEADRILKQIEKEPSNNDEVYPVPKGQFTGLRKYRINDYRVIYAIVGDDVIVLRIGQRKKVYKRGI